LGAGVIERCEAEVVEDDVLGAQDVLDDPPDAVVGQSAVEGVDQFGGGEVADSVAGVDGGVTQCDEHVAFAGAGGSDQHRVLAGPDPFQGGQVIEGGGRDRRGGDVEVV
jgi:hypothetical protein